MKEKVSVGRDHSGYFVTVTSEQGIVSQIYLSFAAARQLIDKIETQEGVHYVKL